MSTLKIQRILPGVAADSTKTPGRKFLQVEFTEAHEDSGFLNAKRTGKRNVWEGYSGDGLSINPDPLYTSIMENVNLSGYKWEELAGDRAATTPVPFKGLIGKKVLGTIDQEYVEPYEVPGSLSQNKTRFQYTAVVFDGESKYSIFAAQGHTIVEDEARLAEIKAMAADVSQENINARNLRKQARSSMTV